LPTADKYLTIICRMLMYICRQSADCCYISHDQCSAAYTTRHSDTYALPFRMELVDFQQQKRL